jgi:enamine deaminase RidA (YjgF/YER057c/UK114 family)
MSATASADRRLEEATDHPLAVYAPQGRVVATRRAGPLLITSGQVAFAGTELLATGKVGAEVDLATGQLCARQCAVNALWRAREALGSLDRVEAVARLTVYVASDPSFIRQSEVATGASEVLVDVLGEAGQHTRAALGVAVLPLDSPVEAELLLVVRDGRAGRRGPGLGVPGTEAMTG